MGKDYRRIRSVLATVVFSTIIGGLFLFSLISVPPAILRSERRYPARFPLLTMETVLSAEFMSRFNNYAADNFPLRDGFRTLNSALVFHVYRQTDNSGLYMDKENKGIGEFKQINVDSVEQLSRKILALAQGFREMNVYYSFIPDKSIYSNMMLPGFDPLLAKQLLSEYPGMDEYNYIDITAALDTESYYRTDLHWNQIMLKGVVEKLASHMRINVDLSRYSLEYAGEFQGVYAGQLALPTWTDSLAFLSNQSLAAMYLNERTMELESGDVYNWEKFSGLDAYDFFLSGAQPLVVLINKESHSDNELYIFRDSFSSSLAPLLASAYAKVTLIDLRYIDMRTLNRCIEFKPGSDVLFLYSSLVLNNSDMLQVY